jgi:hypothetical protein
MLDSTVEDTGTRKPGRRRIRAVKLASGAYQQVASVLGAFSLFVFVSEVWHIGWRGLVGRLVGVWADYVRPAVKLITDAVVWPVEQMLHWDIEIPLVARDYFAVGLVLFLSFYRSVRSLNWLSGASRRERAENSELGIFGNTSRLVRWASVQRSVHGFFFVLGFIAYWPAVLLLFLYAGLLQLIAGFDKDIVRAVSLSILPIVYLAILLATNHFMP